MLGKDFNVKGLEASVKHFYNFSDLQQCEEIANHFYESIESVFSTHHRDYALTFFSYLSPTFLGREKDLKSLKDIYERQKGSENTLFINLLSDEIELFEMILDINSELLSASSLV